MQANLERLGELERRLSVTLPLSDIASEVDSRLKRLSRTVKMQGFRPGKVPLKVVAAAVRPTGAPGSARRCDAEEFRRGGARAESARRGLPPVRTQAAHRGRGRIPVQRDLRGVPRGHPWATFRRQALNRPRARGGRGGSGQDDRDHAQAARALRPGRPARAERRSRYYRFSGHLRGRRVSRIAPARGRRWCWAKAGCCRTSRRSSPA